MFKVGDTVVSLLDKSYGDYKFYAVVKVYKKEFMTLYDIRAIKTGITYVKVPLPEEFYRKLDKAR